MDLPFRSKFFEAPRQLFSETVVFVHHLGGDINSLAPYVRLVNELGFNAVAFDLIDTPKNVFKIPVTADFLFGIRHIWAGQIEAVFNSVAGKKIVFCFSMPSACAFEAIAKRNAEDITAVVCDGGPFLNIAKCLWNLYEHHYKIESKIVRAAFTIFSLALWGPNFTKEMTNHLNKLPLDFKVLSIRGWRDSLVPPTNIDDFFALTDQFAPEIFDLPEGRHLDGLKNFSNLYVPRVQRFITEYSTAKET